MTTPTTTLDTILVTSNGAVALRCEVERVGETVHSTFHCADADTRDYLRLVLGQMHFRSAAEGETAARMTDAWMTADTVTQVAYNAGLIDFIPA